MIATATLLKVLVITAMAITALAPLLLLGLWLRDWLKKEIW